MVIGLKICFNFCAVLSEVRRTNPNGERYAELDLCLLLVCPSRKDQQNLTVSSRNENFKQQNYNPGETSDVVLHD